MNIRLAKELTKESIVDGPGFRAVIWTQGCSHNCYGCHNESTHDFNGGFNVDTKEIKDELKKLKLHKGITLSGGDPFEQPKACLDIVLEAKKLGLDVWAYTGYDFETIIDKNSKKYKDGWYELIEHIDILVDGKFIMDKKDMTLRFRGSDNQRIIDVKKSLKSKALIIKMEYYDGNKKAVI